MVFRGKYDWKITDLSNFAVSKDSDLFSPKFYGGSACGKTHCWQINLAWRSTRPKHYGLFLKLVDQEFFHMIYVKFCLQVFSADNKIVGQNFMNYREFEGITNWGFPKSVPISRCKVRSIKRISCTFEISCEDPDELSMHLNFMGNESFLELYKTGLFSDLKIKCGGRDFKVHKSILATRSDVFMTMVQNDMEESESNIIHIKDSEPEALDVFLKLLYGGVGFEARIPKHCIPKVLDLGEKYNLKDIKDSCAFEMMKQMKNSNAIEFLILSKKYEIAGLKKVLLNYIKGNLDAVMKLSKDWENFLDHQDLVTELFSTR